MRIIDAHAHVIERLCGFGPGGELRPIGKARVRNAAGEELAAFPAEFGDFTFTGERLIELMDAEGIERAVLLQGVFYGFQNEYTMETYRKYPERFIPACTLDPYCLEADKILSRFLDDMGFKAVKFELSTGGGLSSYHAGLSLSSPRMLSVIERIADKGGVLVLDLGKKGTSSYMLSDVKRIAETHPDLKLAVCHLLAPQPTGLAGFEEDIRALDADNIFFDISALPWNMFEEGYPYPSALNCLRTAKGIAGAKRLMWGSDLPGTISRESYTRQISYITESDVFSENEAEWLFSRTAELVYGAALPD